MAVSFTSGNDFIIPTEDGQTYLGGAGNDTYILSESTIVANSTIVIQDTEGTNEIQLVGGLTIASSSVTNNAVQLTLSNGAVIQILGAAAFGFNVGGNALAGIAGTDQTFTEFVEDTLGTTVPAEGGAPSTGGEVEIPGGTVEPETPTFSVAAPAETVEGGDATFTVTLSEAQAAATTVDYAVALGGGATAADVGTYTASGTLTFAAGETTKTITVPVVFDTTAETGETVAVTLSNAATGFEVGTATATTTLVDPPAPTFTITSDITAGQATEEGQTITYTITPSGITDKAYTFTLNTVGDTLNGVAAAASATDFDPASQTVTFAAGTSDAVTVVQTVVNDGVTEGLEGYKTSLLDASYEVVGDPISGTITDPSGEGAGQTFTLSTNLETTEGTSGNDTFNGNVQATAAASTFQTGDVIDGKGGTADTANILVVDDALTGAVVADMSNVEIVNVRMADGSGGAAMTISAATWTGVEQIWSDRSVDRLNIDAMQTLATVGLNDTDARFDVDFKDSLVSGSSDTLKVIAKDSGTSTTDVDLNIDDVTGNGNVIEALMVTGQGTDKSYIDVAGVGNKVKSITVDGTTAVDLAAIDVTALTTVDASAMTGGGLTADLNGAAANLMVTGSDFDDTFDFSGRYTTADTIAGGLGTDNLILNIAEADPAANQTNVTGFEKITIADGAGGADEADVAKFGVTGAIDFLADTVGPVTVTGLVSGATITSGIAVDDLALDVNLSDADGSGDSITYVMLDKTAGTAADIDLDFTGIENVTIDASKATAANGAAIDITNPQLDTLNLIAGVDPLNLSGTALGTVTTTVNASSTTAAGGINVALNGAAVQGATVTGTKNADTIGGSSQADTIIAGGGADRVEAGNGIDTVDLTETTAASDTVDMSGIKVAANRDTIKGFTAGTTTADEIEVAAADTDAATTAGTAPTFNVIGAKSNTHALTDVDFVEFSFDVGDSADLSASTDGTELLKGLATSGDAALSVDTDGDALYLIAYDGGNAYLYYADEGADGGVVLAAADIALVGVLENITVGSLVQGNFDLV